MLKADLSSYHNNGYNPGPLWKRVLWFWASHIFINSYLIFPMSLKIVILKLFGAKTGKNITLKPKVNIKYPWMLTMGDNVWIGEEVWIDNLSTVTIGNNVCLSQGAFLLIGNHDYTKISFDLMLGEIVLEDGVWIGAKATVCGGVTCGSHAVLSVNSVATSNLEPYSVYQGNPAVFRKKREIIK